ncbi:cell cycle control protein [Scheffersomyces amazonensis]|uniref:cell cycle control protein n=1 Tax=Scheffersomyces amazonensis TaxID=1078765 RepID=UPI00315D8088
MTSNGKTSTSEQYLDLIKRKVEGDQDVNSEIESLQYKQNDEAQQKVQWVKTRKTIEQLIAQKLTKKTIQEVTIEIFQINLIRYLGILVRAIMKHQLKNISKTSVLASLTSILNSKIPEIGELLVNRLILQFRKNLSQKNYAFVRYSSLFISHLVNQKVVNEILILQIIQKLMEIINGDTIDILIRILCINGQYLTIHSGTALNSIFSGLSKILHEQNHQLSKRSIQQLKMLLQIRKTKFKDYPIIENGLDLVEDDDKEVHIILLDGIIHSKSELNVFQFDQDYKENEENYLEIKKEILGDDDDDDDDEEEEDEEKESHEQQLVEEKPKEIIQDLTESQLLEFQKKVYLTVMSSLSPDEAVHKLLKLKFRSDDKEDNRKIIVDMIIKCCAQEKTYSKFYGVIGEKLCVFGNGKSYQPYHGIFVTLFKSYYEDIEKFETNSLRNLGKFFGHLFASDKLAIDKCWNDIKLTEEYTNASSRILLKFIFQEMIEELGTQEVKERLINDEYIKPYINGVFPVVDVDWRDADDIRFSINYFTAIGLGVLTEEMRQVLNDLPPPPSESEDENDKDDRGRPRSRRGSGSGSSRYSSYSRSVSYSRSRSASRNSRLSFSRSPSRTPSRSPQRKRRENDTSEQDMKRIKK